MSWLKRDAWNRFWRTILQTVALVVLAPAADAAVQVVQLAMLDSMAGKPFDVDRVVQTAMYAAGSGVALAILAYLHRVKLDPSPLPSAEPPKPPTAPRTSRPL